MTQPALTRYAASELPALTLPSHYTVQEISKTRDTTIFSSLSHVEQRLSFWQFSPKSWVIHIPAFTVTELEAFFDFWDDRSGQGKPFKWVSPLDDVTHYVRFDTGTPKFTLVLPRYFAGSFTLRQVSDNEINELG